MKTSFPSYVVLRVMHDVENPKYKIIPRSPNPLTLDSNLNPKTQGVAHLLLEGLEALASQLEVRREEGFGL